MIGSFGFGEIILILIIAFLILGPAKFQKFIKKIGEAMGMYKKFKSEIETSVRETENNFDSLIAGNKEQTKPVDDDTGTEENIFKNLEKNKEEEENNKNV